MHDNSFNIVSHPLAHSPTVSLLHVTLTITYATTTLLSLTQDHKVLEHSWALVSPHFINLCPHHLGPESSNFPFLKPDHDQFFLGSPKDSLDHSDESLQGLPIGLQEYFAPYPNGDILLLALPISGIYHNINEDPEHSATIGIKDELATLQRNGSHWAANRRRISVFGKVQPVTEWEEAKALYERFHPDSRLWDGDDGPHSSAWVRLQVSVFFRWIRCLKTQMSQVN